MALQNGEERIFIAAVGDVGDEAEPPLVDADDRDVVAGELAPDAQQRAVAPHHQSQIASGAELRNIQHRMLGEAGVERGFPLQRHIATLVVQKVNDVINGVP